MGLYREHYLLEKISLFSSENLGFTVNLYNSCVTNKNTDGKQANIGWHVDDVKISDINNNVFEDYIPKISDEFGKEAPLTVTCCKIHEY